MERPTSLTVFGILNLVFGILGFFGICGSYAMLHSPLGQANPVIKIMHDQPAYLEWMKIGLILGLVGALAAIVSGAGLLKSLNWARQLAIGYAILTIVTGLVSIVMNVRFLVGPLFEHARQALGPEAAGAFGGAIGGMIGGFVALLYPIILLIFMTTPSIIRACKHEPPPLPNT